jgi:hypothetical protein
MRSRLARISAYGLAVITILAASANQALAGGPIGAPEIDGASVSAGLGVLAAGILILRSRRRSK